MKFEKAPELEEKQEIPQESSGEQSRNEKHAEKIDDAFDDLIDKVKNSPEAERVALEALISQMRQIAEQIKQTRDMKHIHELKKMMLKHWGELNELTQGNPELFKTISAWGKKFVESKIIFYDMINEVKDELMEKSQEIQASWNDMQVDIGKIAGWTGIDGTNAVQHYLESKKKWGGSGIEIDWDKEWGNKKRATMDDFIKSLRDVIKGFDEADINVPEAVEFLERLNGLIRELTSLCYKEGSGSGASVIARHPEAEEILRRLSEQSKIVSKNISEASKIYKTTKKIRDTHFLELYAEGVAA